MSIFHSLHEVSILLFHLHLVDIFFNCFRSRCCTEQNTWPVGLKASGAVRGRILGLSGLRRQVLYGAEYLACRA